ncbi:MAG: M18 family aminopeptidase [Proteobacteria bacterium]|nr:MAG: M18 family aminopeptidase [Pseudomonadota bacterium]
MIPTPDATRALLAYIDASPTPYHCAAESARMLDAAGFTRLEEGARWQVDPGAASYFVRDGSLIAFRVGTVPPAEGGFRVVGAHTDSPTLQLKPDADVTKAGYQQLGVEVYGGALDYTWLDRDLGLAGRVVLAGAGRAADLDTRLVDLRRPLLRVPSLAIHLNRDIRTKGLNLNRQRHLVPTLGLAGEGAEGLRELLAAELDVAADRVLSWDLSLVDVVPSTVGGWRGEFIFAPRLDNQASSHAALSALIAADAAPATQVVCLYDHEEVGSQTTTGAEGPLIEWTLRRLAAQDGAGETDALARAVARSFQVSADMAHAVHPNWEDRHEPNHHPHLNAGPVIKVNANQRYATSGEGAALFEALCREAQVPVQRYVNRTDLPCGSTIGPISAARLGMRTVDVGNPMLSMHSIREQAGVLDHPWMIEVMTRWLGA